MGAVQKSQTTSYGSVVGERRTSAVWCEWARPTPVEPDSAATPEEAPENEGSEGAELGAIKGIDTGVDQAGINKGATDPPAKHPGEQKADGLKVASHG